MKLTYVALLGSMLAFTACDNSSEDFGSTEMEDPRIETNTTTPSQTQSGASSSQARQPVNPSDLPPVPPRDENIQVTPPAQPRN